MWGRTCSLQNKQKQLLPRLLPPADVEEDAQPFLMWVEPVVRTRGGAWARLTLILPTLVPALELGGGSS